MERETIKSVIRFGERKKLMKLHDIFVPSMMYGTYCNTVYTTYYDFWNCSFPEYIFENLKKMDIKRVRIRHYYFDPNSYFEIKYKNHKIRVLIDCDLNVLEPENVDAAHKDLVFVMIQKIRAGKLKELFYNTYKRYSFIYKNDTSIRMTIDTDIVVKYRGMSHTFEFDILEVKYDVNTPLDTILSYFDEINRLAGVHIRFQKISKADFTIHNMIIPDRYKADLRRIDW
jgi:hypothetical protein